MTANELPFAEYVAAAIIEVARTQPAGISVRFEDLPQVIEDFFHTSVNVNSISDAVQILVDCGIAYFGQDPLAGTFVRVSQEKYNAFLDGVRGDLDRYHRAIDTAGDDYTALSRAEEIRTPTLDLYNRHKVLQKYSEFGSPFISTAMQRMADPDVNERLSRGADRIVSFSDNQPVVDEIREGLAQIASEIESSNEIAVALGDAREEALSEVRALSGVMQGKQARASYLLSQSQQVLTWIARLVAKTSLEEVVKHIAKILIGWLS